MADSTPGAACPLPRSRAPPLLCLSRCRMPELPTLPDAFSPRRNPSGGGTIGLPEGFCAKR
jgi:hypothetical protein